MATEQCPPQEELEFKIRGDKPVFQGQIAVAGDITSKWFRDNAYDTDTLALRVTMDSPFGPDVVYTHCEITNPSTRLGLLAGGIQKGTEEYKPLTVDDEGRLCVDAAISIGEVQLDVEIRAEDGDSAGSYFYIDGNVATPIPANALPDGRLRVSDEENNPLGKYFTNDLSEAPSGITYVGQESLNGAWLIRKLEETGQNSLIQYANVSNNVGFATYPAAWADRASLSYARASTLSEI